MHFNIFATALALAATVATAIPVAPAKPSCPKGSKLVRLIDDYNRMCVTVKNVDTFQIQLCDNNYSADQTFCMLSDKSKIYSRVNPNKYLVAGLSQHYKGFHYEFDAKPIMLRDYAHSDGTSAISVGDGGHMKTLGGSDMKMTRAAGVVMTDDSNVPFSNVIFVEEL